MDFSDSFRNLDPVCIDKQEVEDTKRSNHNDNLLFQQMDEWRLPIANSIAANEAYLNEQLSYLLSSVDFEDTRVRFSSKSDDDVMHLMQVVQYILYLRQSDDRQVKSLSDRVIQLQTDLKRTTSRLENTTERWNIEKQSVSELSNRLAAKEKAFVAEKNQFKIEKRELEKRLMKLTHVDTQYKATLRKNEQQYTRLQKQLTGLLQKSTTASKQKQIRMTAVLNDKENVRQAAGDGGNNNDTEDDQVLSRMVLASYEKRTQLLCQENDELRDSLDAFRMELKQLTTEYRSAVRLLFSKYPNQQDATLELDESETVAEALAQLREKIHHLKSSVHTGSESPEELHRIIQEQDKLLRLALKEDTTSRRVADLSYVDMLQEELETERESLASSRVHMEQERQQFLTQATQLDQDRVAFQMKRQQLMFGGPGEPQSPRPTSPMQSDGSDFPAPTPHTKALLRKIDGLSPLLAKHLKY